MGVWEWYSARMWKRNAFRGNRIWEMDPLLKIVEHRPWPLPSGPWIMRQIWHDLLFAHWLITPEALRPLVPAQLELDRFQGKCWVGVVPFWMSGVRARGVPAIPGLSRFPELNVRTYVKFGGTPGVYFFSLDAGNRAAVWAARALYHLPYFLANMSVERSQERIEYSSRRDRAHAEFRGRYAAAGEARRPASESIEHFLTERYCLFTVHGDDVYRCDIHHPPWPLQQARAEIEVNTTAQASGISLPKAEPLLHFSACQEVLVWPLHRAQK